jgi:hypothetical protein
VNLRGAGEWAAVAIALSLAAEAPAAEPRKRPGRYKLGPVYLSPSLELRNAGVDTNVFNSRTDPVRDVSAVLSPALSGVLPVGQRLLLTAEGNLAFNYFRRQTSERSTDFGGNARAEAVLGRVALFGGFGGGQFRNRFAIDLDERLQRQERHGEAGVSVNLTRTIALTARAGGRVLTLPRGNLAVKQSLDRNELSATVEARYAITRRTALLASTAAIEDRFFSQSEEFSRKNRSFRHLGGFSFGERALINGSVMAGFRVFPDTASQDAPPYKGPVLAVNAFLPLPGSARLNGIAERDVAYAAQGRTRQETLRRVYVFSRYRGEAVSELIFGLIGLGFLDYESAKYLQPDVQQGGFYNRVDRRWTLGGSLLRQLGDSIRVGLRYEWTRRRSNLQGLDYTGTRYGVQAEIRP